MGQVALGFRSLLIKSAVFFLMAALLAWALGGTLWPRAETADGALVQFDGNAWFWRLAVGGREPGGVQWTLMREQEDGEPIPGDDGTWHDAAGPIVSGDALWYAVRPAGAASAWDLVRLDASGARSATPMPDRLAIERQFARIVAGLPVETPERVARQRALIIDPPVAPDSASP